MRGAAPELYTAVAGSWRKQQSPRLWNTLERCKEAGQLASPIIGEPDPRNGVIGRYRGPRGTGLRYQPDRHVSRAESSQASPRKQLAGAPGEEHRFLRARILKTVETRDPVSIQLDSLAATID
jgi:hypothetical protein